MIRMTLSEYLREPKDYRGVWTTERWDLPDWEKEREKYMGKRTLMTNIDGATCLVIEGMSLEIIDDSDWKKPDGRTGIVGGLLYHGNPDQSFAVLLNPIHGWSIHT